MSKVRVLAVGDPAVDAYVKDETLLKRFEQQTGIEVQFDVIPWVDYYGVLMESFQEYRYDIVMVAGHLWLREFVDKGYLVELGDSFRSKPEYDYDDILPSIRGEMILDNKLFLAPSFCDGHILLYRKSMLNRLPNETVSMDELVELVKEHSDGDRDSFVLKAHPSEIFLDSLPYLRSGCEDAFAKDGAPMFHTAEGIAALEKYIGMKRFCNASVSGYGNEKVCEALQHKQCKLGVSWGGQLGKIMDETCEEPDDIGFAGLETSWNVTWAFGMNHLCGDKESALKFLEYITSAEVDRKVGAYCGNPTRLSSFREDREKYSWYPTLLGMLSTARPLPHLSYMGQAIGIMTECITDAFEGRCSAAQALAQAEIRVNLLREGRLRE